MRTIRLKTFETNSSSCHTITFVNNDSLVDYWSKNDFHELRMSSEENYYAGGEFNDPPTKAMYFSDALSAYVLRELSTKIADYYKVAGVREEDFTEEASDYAKERLLTRTLHNGKHMDDQAFENQLFNFAESLKIPDEIMTEMSEWVSQIKDSIEGYFENEGVKIIWTSSDSGEDWTKTFKPEGSIDHQSNIYEDDNCLELAELFMNVPLLYKWIMSKQGSLYLDCDG